MHKLILLALLGFSIHTHGSDLHRTLAGRGIWLQNPSELNAALITQLKASGFRRVHVMATHSPIAVASCSAAQLPKTMAPTEKILDVVKTLKTQGFVTVLTIYLPPTKDAVVSLTNTKSSLIPLGIAAGADAVELDLEGGWSNHPNCGYGTHQAAFLDLKQRIKNHEPGIPVGITTHLGRVNDSRIHWLSLQAYSTCKKKDCPEFKDPTKGPGGKQQRIAALLVSYKKPVVVGLAAYSQSWAGHSIAEAMQRAYNTTTALIKTDSKYIGYSYWSTRWALKPTSEQFAFLKSTIGN